MSGSFKEFRERCKMRITGSEHKTSAGCTFIDVCRLYKGKAKCTEKNCPLHGGEKRGN